MAFSNQYCEQSASNKCRRGERRKSKEPNIRRIGMRKLKVYVYRYEPRRNMRHILEHWYLWLAR